MANLVLVMGPTGTGKSTSIKTLNPKETVIINVLGKTLPFKGSQGMYSEEKKNLFNISNHETVAKYLVNISEKSPDTKVIVIDDSTYIMRTEFFDRSKEKGYDKYNELADHFRKIIACCNSLRADLTVFMMIHSEPVESEGSIIGYKVSTVGKLLDKLYNPVESVSVALYCDPTFDEKGIPTYGFHTHKKLVKGIELPCKTPEGMFEEDFIPNDLALVQQKVHEYYFGE